MRYKSWPIRLRQRDASRGADRTVDIPVQTS